MVILWSPSPMDIIMYFHYPFLFGLILAIWLHSVPKCHVSTSSSLLRVSEFIRHIYKLHTHSMLLSLVIYYLYLLLFLSLSASRFGTKSTDLSPSADCSGPYRSGIPKITSLLLLLVSLSYFISFCAMNILEKCMELRFLSTTPQYGNRRSQRGCAFHCLLLHRLWSSSRTL